MNPHHWLLAAALEEINQIDRAISTCRAAMKVVPEDAQHLIFLGRIYIRKREYSKAAKILRKAVLLKPDSEDAQCLLAEALSSAGKTSE